MPVAARRRFLVPLAAAALVVPAVPAVAAALPAPRADNDLVAETPHVPTVRGVRTLGRSVQGRRLRAYHLGEPDAPVTAVVLGSMHGDEQAGMATVHALRSGRPVVDVDLWVIPTMNPDGVAAHRRQNARGVDLNRNFPHRWAPLTGRYYSGTGPASEPETRAVLRFLREVRPRFVVSFHQPLRGVGRSSKSPAFQRRLARGLGLPLRSFDCTGVCHGTMTSWFNATQRGAAITVEFGPAPRRGYLRGRAARGTLRAVGGARP